MSRSLIEQWFPAAAVGAESMRERGSAKALPPINFLHVWWARRPLVASRAAVVASLLPAWPSAEEAAADERAATIRDSLEGEFGDQAAYHAWFVRSIGILGDPVAAAGRAAEAKERGTRLKSNPYSHERAFTISPDESTLLRLHKVVALRAAVCEPPLVLDSFAGGGSIPFEAARYGFATIANELNPVAAAILEGTVSLPGKLGERFADTIATYGARWSMRVEQRLAQFFPSQDGESILDYVWAHTVPCPSTGLPTPLVPDFWLSRGNSNDTAVRLDVDAEASTMSTTIVHGPDAAEAGPRSTYKNGTATSVWTGETFGGDYIRVRSLSGDLGQFLLAIVVLRPESRARQFRAPTKVDLAAMKAAEQELIKRLPVWEIDDLVPSEPVFEGKETKRSVDMGLRRWRDMFTPRQLLTNLTALEELVALGREARREQPESEARALSLYLAFALDKAVDYNGRLSSWDATRLKVRNTFDRHDFAFKWTFAEIAGANSGTDALIAWATKNAVLNHRKICALLPESNALFNTSRLPETRIILGSATALPFDDASVDAVITDPPYYDNVMYGECSDYFYVWLKRSLRESWPEFVKSPLADKESEAVANPALFKDLATHSGRGRRPDGTVTAAELADSHYEQLLTRSFREAFRVLKADGVMTVMFTHKRVDAWDTLGQALLEAGFAIRSSWPVHTESEHSLHQAKKNAASSTIFLTCRKRETAEPAWWSDIRGEVEQTVAAAVTEFAKLGIRGVDLTLATFGPALSVLSRRWPVYTGELDEDGRPEVLRPDVALDLAREKVTSLKKRGLLAGREVEFDRVTDWYLLAWSDFLAVEFPFDEARKLSIALHLDVDELKQRHKVVRALSGTVTLLTPAQRRTAGALDPDATSWATQIDALHALMLVYDEEGLGAAQAWLDRTGRRDDQNFAALIEAALRAIPRVRQKDELIRPEARVLESIRQTLFPSIQPPAEPTPPAEQLALEPA